MRSDDKNLFLKIWYHQTSHVRKHGLNSNLNCKSNDRKEWQFTQPTCLQSQVERNSLEIATNPQHWLVETQHCLKKRGVLIGLMFSKQSADFLVKEL